MGSSFWKKRTDPLSPLTSPSRCWVNQRGTTLAEMMIYLGILMLLMLLLLPIIHTFLKPLGIFTQIRLEREAALFFRHTEIEVNEAAEYAVNYSENPNELILYVEDDTVSYYQQGQKILRTKSSQAQGGNLEMAHFVKEVHFSEINNRLFNISLTLEENGIEYTVERLIGLKVTQQPQVVEEAFVEHE